MARTPAVTPTSLPDEMDLTSPPRGAQIGAMEALVDDERPQRRAAPDQRVVVRDLSDDDERLTRIKRARARHMAEMRANPFYADEVVGIPQLPDDDPEWSYKWVRHSLPGMGTAENRVVDTKNLQLHSHGRLPYDYVRMKDLPPEWQARLQAFSVLEGKHEGQIVYNDLVAARTPRKLRDMKVAADNRRAEELRESLKRETAEDMYARADAAGYGSGFKVYTEDNERPARERDYEV
jgi:hypothetical protein